VFAKVRNDLPGTVKLIFQPAEEGAPPGEEGGARLMIQQGVLQDPAPEVIFGLHVTAPGRTGAVYYRPGATMAGSDSFRITVKGKGTHGARPWGGVDPIVLAAQIILGLQTIQSRQVDVTSEPSVLTIGTIQAGTRHNIISDKAEMDGTLRTFNVEMRDYIKKRVNETSEAIAKSGGGDATVQWASEGYIPLINNVPLTQRMLPTLQRVAGKANVIEAPRRTGAEDFSFFAQEIPGFFFHVGITPPNTPMALVATNHSPRFQVDESGLLQGLRYMLHVATDYMASGGAAKKTD
jgi:amidohydrolase